MGASTSSWVRWRPCLNLVNRVPNRLNGTPWSVGGSGGAALGFLRFSGRIQPSRAISNTSSTCLTGWKCSLRAHLGGDLLQVLLVGEGDDDRS